MIKKVTIKKLKPRNAGTLTESAFWSLIRSSLRNTSRWWKPIALAKKKAKRPYKGPNSRQRFEYQCNICKNYFSEKFINVDHIIPVGSLTCKEDLPGFVERLFVEVDKLQCLCNVCHDQKTKNEKK